MLSCLPPDNVWDVVRYLDFDSYLNLRSTLRIAYSEFVLCRFVYHLLQQGDRRALRLAVYYQLPEGVIRYYIRGRQHLITAWRWYTLLCARVFGIQPVVNPQTWRGLKDYTEAACMALGFGCGDLAASPLGWELISDHHWIPSVPWPAIGQIYFSLPTSSNKLRYLQELTRCLERQMPTRYERHPEHYDTIMGQLEWLANLHPPYRMGTLVHLLPHGGPHLAQHLRRAYALDSQESWAWIYTHLGALPTHILDWIPSHLHDVLVTTVRRLLVQIYQRAAIQLQHEDHIQDEGYARLKSYMHTQEWLWPAVGDSLNSCRRGAHYVDVFWSRLVE